VEVELKTEVKNGSAPSVSGRSSFKRRVVLWDYHIEPALVKSLQSAGIDVVATIDGRVDGIPHFSLAEMQFGSKELSSQYEPLACRPSAEMLRIYIRSASRIGLVPWSGVMTVHYGGLLEPSEIEDWAQLHMHQSAKLLLSLSANEVWFFTVPHLGVDNAMHEIAMHLGLRVLILRQLIFPAKFLFHAWVHGVRIFPRVEGFSKWVKDASALDLFYMRPRRWRGLVEALLERSCAILAAIRVGKFRHLLGRLYTGALDRKWWSLVRLLEFSDSATRSSGALHASMSRAWKRNRSNRRMVALAEVREAFVYFPLHYEPEANSDIYGGRYTNQIDAIDAICRSLPERWIVLLKENPKQTFLRRSPAFFKRIESLARVYWVDDATPTEDLRRRSAVSATITGTVGWESLCGGRACVYFGEPWYATMPGAVRFIVDIDLVEVSNIVVHKCDLDAALKEFLSQAADGLAAARYAGQLPEDLNQVMAADLTAQSLLKITHAVDLMCEAMCPRDPQN